MAEHSTLLLIPSCCHLCPCSLLNINDAWKRTKKKEIRLKKEERKERLSNPAGHEQTEGFAGGSERERERERDGVRLINSCCSSFLFADFIITVQWSLSFLISTESLFVPQTVQLSNPFPRLTATNDALTFQCWYTWGAGELRNKVINTAGKMTPLCPFSSHHCLIWNLVVSRQKVYWGCRVKIIDLMNDVNDVIWGESNLMDWAWTQPYATGP